MAEYTPMMMQYLQVKEKLQDAIVFYRLGDFYEMFFEDAKVASKELDLVLTGRNAGQEEKVPMCGVPFHAANTYLQRLVSKGYKVAIVEQLEEAGSSKGIVKRDVIKIVTPGTMLPDEQNEKDVVTLASIYDYGYGYYLCIVDLSTGETIGCDVSYNSLDVKAIAYKNNIKEFICQSDFNQEMIDMFKEMNIIVSFFEDAMLENRYLKHLSSMDDVKVIHSYGLLINYLELTQKRVIDHLQTLKYEDVNEKLKMDYNTILNLELVRSLKNDSKSETLWSFMDHTSSSMGSRLLRKLIEHPLVNQNEIEKRLDQITTIKNDLLCMNQLKKSLENIYDLQRLIAKVALGSSNPIDLVRLLKTLEEVPNIKLLLKKYEVFHELLDFEEFEALKDRLENALVEQVPVSIKDGGVFKEGYDVELDRLNALSNGGKDWILELEQREKEKTGIKNLKIGYNRVFGYYIEISKGQLNQVKDEFGYIRKQTLTNQERFITQELKEKEDEILKAQENALKKEYLLYEELLAYIKDFLNKLQHLAMRLAYIDCLLSLAILANQPGYQRPTFHEYRLDIKQGRHPILNKLMKHGKFVANDCFMEHDDVLMITGPNMGGKSTYMRQLALLVIMGQIGSYLPCVSATLPIFDQIFTRIGASDDILSGQSTFMVEMNEANYALKHASKNSLILFDEIGRGTSTYDGMSLAQAMIEYIANHIKAKTLFSTHYHELTSLENQFDNIKNYHVLVHEKDHHVTFMYKVVKGKADKSYGINVARLASLPSKVIARASALLNELEGQRKVVMQSFDLFQEESVPFEYEEVIDTLKHVDVNRLTPMDALLLINKLKKDIQDE